MFWEIQGFLKVVNEYFDLKIKSSKSSTLMNLMKNYKIFKFCENNLSNLKNPSAQI